MSISRKPILSTELLASRKPFADGIFVIGPFASRVSFSSQQRRAISLVCDISQDFEPGEDWGGLRSKKVCVVGAGLAGITAAAVAAALGAQVFVLDAAPRGPTDDEHLNSILATIRDAHHRDGHPSLNFWPHEDIEPITRLPLLNWHEGPCDEVARQIAEEFGRLRNRDEMGAGIVAIVNSLRVKGLRRVEARSPYERNRWKVVPTKDSTPSRQWDVDYDVVIFATGFGIETGGHDTPSYWSAEEDRIAAIGNNPPPEIKNFVVSGTGDGGLIEALRLVFKEKRAGNIEEQMMVSISSSTFRDNVAKIENEAVKILNDFVVHGEKKGISGTAKNQLSSFLWLRYADLVEHAVTDIVIDRLSEKRHDKIDQVILLGQWDQPMEMGASPFHRLMVAICVKKGWIRYIKSRKNIVRRNVRELPLGGSGIKVPIADLTVFEAGKVETTSLKDSFYVARHGYVTPLSKIWPKETVAQIKYQQNLFADQDEIKPSYSDKISALSGSPNPNNLDVFFKGIKPKIVEYFENVHNLDAKFEVIDRKSRKEGIRLWLRSGAARKPNGPAVPMSIFDREILNRTEIPGPRDLGPGGNL